MRLDGVRGDNLVILHAGKICQCIPERLIMHSMNSVTLQGPSLCFLMFEISSKLAVFIKGEFVLL